MTPTSPPMLHMMMQRLLPIIPLKGGEEEAQKVSDDIKIGVHKAVSDAKIAAHEAGSQIKEEDWVRLDNG